MKIFKIFRIDFFGKVGFQFMLILGLLGMYFDAAVVFVTKSSLLFKVAVAILCNKEVSIAEKKQIVREMMSETKFTPVKCSIFTSIT